MQEESNEELLKITGGIAIGPANGTLVAGCLRSATTHGLRHELLGRDEMRRRFPQFALAEDEVGSTKKRLVISNQRNVFDNIFVVQRSAEQIFVSKKRWFRGPLLTMVTV